MTILLEKCNSDAQIPEYKREGDVGMDLRADNFKTAFSKVYDEQSNVIAEEENNEVSEYSSAVIAPGDRMLIGTGIKVAIPKGYEMQVRPRSGLAINNGVTVVNSPGTIDCNYRGEIGVILINHGHIPFHISKNDRIAQAVIAKAVDDISFEEGDLDSTNRGEEGFGSSGVK